MAGELNGKTGEYIRYVIGLGLAGLVAYYTAIGTLRESVSVVNGRVGVVEQREQGHFDEVLRRLDRIERTMERIEATGVDRRTGEPLAIQRQFDK